VSYWTEAEEKRFAYFELDGARSPGVLVGIEINGIPLKYDSQQGFGLSGEFLKFTGLGLAEWKFTLRLIDAEDRAANDAGPWRKATAPPPQGRTDRLRSVKHPVLERFRPAVTLGYLQEIPAEVPATTEGGGVTITYPFKAYRKPLPQVGKPKTPASAVTAKVPNANQARIADLTKQISAELTKAKQ
jgi:hypothetical protein